MKKLMISLALIAGIVTISCNKETIVERVEIQKGNKILSGTGAPDAALGEEGDYYLDLTNTNLYGAKSKDGWGAPIALKGLPGTNGQTPHIGENGNWYVGDIDLGIKAQGANGQTPRIGENGNWYVGDIDLGVKAKGADGVSPHIGENGHWFVGSTDLGVRAQRTQEQSAGQDAQGNSGSNGVTPHIGLNGHWFVGTQDTGVKAQGAQGIPGTNGRDGKDGSKIYGDIGTPTNSRGNEGDWYIDTRNKRLYGPKTATGWPTTYMSLSVSEGQAQSGHSNDYELSPDGKTLKFWKNRSTTTLDMEADPVLRNVTTIDDRAFYGQTNLTSVKLPKKLKVIGEAAFQYCGLTTITIPENVVIIKLSAFYNNQITTVTFDSVQPPATVGTYSSVIDGNKVRDVYVPVGSIPNYNYVLSSIAPINLREKS